MSKTSLSGSLRPKFRNSKLTLPGARKMLLVTFSLWSALPGMTARAQQERMLGLDVSAWQGNISQTTWNNIRNNENRRFVFIRSSRGGTTGYYNQNDSDNSDGLNTFSQRYDDPYFVQNINRATTAGLLAGSYHFSRPDIIETTQNSGGIANTGVDEADHFIQMAGAWMRPGYLLPVHDLEAGQAQRTSAQLSQFAVDFSDRVYQVMGIRPLVYVSQSYANYINSTVPQVHPDIWIARYANQTDPESIDVQNGHPPPSPSTANVYGKWNPNHTVENPYPDGHPWRFWQYASTVRLQSFNNGGSNLDGNVAQGGIEFVKDFLVPAVWTHNSSGQWTTLTNWNSGLPPIAPVPGPGQVTPVGTQTLPTPRLPTSNDTVVLERPNADITVTLSSGSHTIRKLVAREALDITGGSLTIGYVPSWDSSSYSARISAAMSLSGGASLSADTIQVDPAHTFSAGNGTLVFRELQLLPGITPGTLVLNGNPSMTALTGGTNRILGATGSGSLGRIDLSGGNRSITVSGTTDLSIEVPIQNGALTKSGSGILQLKAASSYSGGTTVSAGTLSVNNSSGSGTGSGSVTVSGGTLTGTGTIGGTVSLGGTGTAAPGHVDPVGTLTLGGLTCQAGGKFQWHLRDASSAPGLGWDKLAATGSINVTATSEARFILDVTSLTTGNNRGETANFDGSQSYSWIIAEAVGGILNFAPEKFQLNTASFDNPYGNGVFSLSQDGNVIRLNFTPAGPPAIISHPQSQSTVLNGEVTFSTSAVGASPLFYQWHFNGSDLPLANGTSFTRANAQAEHAGNYSVVVWNAFGSATSSVATLTVILPPAITGQPASVTNIAGTTATFTVASTGTSPNHQWFKNGSPLHNEDNVSGATSPTLLISSVSMLDEGLYSVIISNGAGSVTSSVAMLTVATPPSITREPRSQIRLAGEDAAFEVVAHGFQPLAYQWKKDGQIIEDATSSTLLRPALQAHDAGVYSVTISNLAGIVASADAGLVVIPTAPIARVTNIWNIRAGSRPYVTTGNTERGAAINPFTGHLLLATRSAEVAGALGIYILDVNDGSELGTMNVTPITNNATFKLNKIGVAEDGAIYGANLTTASLTSDLVIYRWANEGAVPTIAFAGKPDSGVTPRWGDSFAIRGGGTNTQIIISGSSTTTNIALFSTSDGQTFQVTKLTAAPAVAAGEFSQGLAFGHGDTFYSKHASHSSNVVKQFEFTLQPAAATQVTNLPIDPSAMSLRALPHQNLLCSLLDDNTTNNSGHEIKLFNISNPSSPVLLSNFYFLPIAAGTNSPNSNRAGAIDTDGTHIVALDTQNGLVALKLLFGHPPAVVIQPTNQTAGIGQSVQFSVTVSGDAPLSFRWRKGGVDLSDDLRISGTETDTLTISNTMFEDTGAYSVVISNPVGSTTSDAATLTVIAAPTIISHPTNLLVKAGANAAFHVQAEGLDVTYQWRFNGNSITDATQASFALPSVQASDSGYYSVEVSNAGGTTTSSNAILTVSTDQLAPFLSITYPSPRQKITTVEATNGMVTISGTAADHTGIARVEYQFNESPWQVAEGTLHWRAVVSPRAGTNTFSIRASDSLENISSPIPSSFVYVTHSLLSVSVSGGGTVSPNLGNQSLENGKGYRMTAVPLSVDWLFTNWTRTAEGNSTIVSTNPVFDFLMESNLVLQANFITNPFVRAAGQYIGLVYDTNGISHHNSGFFTLKITPKLAYSGKLLLDGNPVTFSGKLSIPGTANREVLRTKFGKTPLQLGLALDFADRVSGQVASDTWTANLEGDRVIWTTNLTQQATAFTNTYTMTLPGFQQPAQGPNGASYGIVKVDKLGKVRFSGRSADNQPIRQGTRVSKSGEWPLYVPMYKLKKPVLVNGVMKTNQEFQGSMLGWISFSPNQPAGTTNLAPLGTVSWIKTGWTNSLYTVGFTNVSSSVASRFIPPATTGVKVLSLSDSQLVLHGGNLGEITNLVTLQSNNTLLVRSSPLLLLRGTISRSGQMQGVFTHPGLNNQQTKYYGVALQDHDSALGYFVGTNEGGSMKLTP